jgi:hypothetical protein
MPRAASYGRPAHGKGAEEPSRSWWHILWPLFTKTIAEKGQRKLPL